MKNKRFYVFAAFMFIFASALIMFTGCGGNDGKDGSATQSLNVSGTVEQGNYLALAHNLNRDDLTFTAQFVKDGYIYDYSDYDYYFGEGMTVQTGQTVFNSLFTQLTSATTLSNGNVLIAYSDADNSGYGTFVIYNSSGTLVAGPTVFESFIQWISATTLSNGNVLIAYSDGDGTFVIYNSSGTIVAGPTVFESASTGNISATSLTNGNVLIAYRDADNSDYGTFVIYNSSGTLVAGPTVFESAPALGISATTLSNGNVLIAYKDWGNSDYGTSVVYSSSGTIVAGPTVFESASTGYISATTLTNEDVLIAYSDGGNSNYGTFVILGQKALKLQKVNSSEVRLWNYTGETLELMLSVDQ